VDKVRPLLNVLPFSLEEIIAAVETGNENNVIKVMRWLVDNDKVVLDKNGKYRWS